MAFPFGFRYSSGAIHKQRQFELDILFAFVPSKVCNDRPKHLSLPQRPTLISLELPLKFPGSYFWETKIGARAYTTFHCWRRGTDL